MHMCVQICINQIIIIFVFICVYIKRHVFQYPRLVQWQVTGEPAFVRHAGPHALQHRYTRTYTIHTLIQTDTYVLTHIQTDTHVQTPIQTDTHVQTPIQMNTYTNRHTYKHLHKRTRTFKHLYREIHVQTHHTYTHTTYTHTTYTHTNLQTRHASSHS